MASSYTGLGTELMTTGENAGSWGTTTNTNLQILEQISGGYTAQSIAGSAQTTTLSVSDGSTGAVLAHRVIEFTGTITGNQIVTIPLDVQQLYVIKNNTSGAYTVQLKYVSGSGDSVTWGTSDKGTKLLYAAADHASNPNLVDSNIGGVGAVDLNGATLTLDADGDTDITADTDDQIDIKIAGADDFQFTANTFTAQSGSTIAAQALTATTITASGIVKTDDTTEATSTTDGSLQTDGGLSVAKDAVLGDDLKLLSDSAVLSFGADSDTTLTHTDGTGLTLNSANKFLFRDTGLYINSSTDGQLDIVADTEVQIAATTIDINGAIAMDGAITGATNITLSGELDAATLDISGNADIDGTTNLDAVDIDGAVQIDGTLTTGVDDTGVDVKFFGATSGSFLLWDESDDALELTDSTKVKIGDGGDMEIYHDGSNSYITNSTGALKLATETSGIALTLGHSTSEVTVADNLTVTGDLTVNGTTTTVNSTTVTIDDPIFTLGGDSAPGSDDNKDRGIEFRYHDGSNARIGFMGYDDSATGFTFLTAASNSSEVFSGTEAKIIAGSLDISGDADIDGTLETDALSIGSTTVTATAAEINLIDGGTARGTTAVADGDGLLVNDGGTMRMTNVTTLKTYFTSAVSSAADDISVGDAAVTIGNGNTSADITIDSGDDVVIDAAGGNVEFKDAGTLQLSLDMDGTAGVQIIKLGVDSDDLVFQQYDGNEVMRINDDRKLYFYDDGGESISSDGTDFTFASGNDINLTATTDINVPANVGVTFGNDGEKIEGDGTDLTIAGNNINLTAVADVVIPANVGITFGSGEKIEGDSTDLTITSGAKINLTATSDVVIPANVGITFGSGEKIEGDSTDLTITSGADIALTATADVNLPNNVGMVFGDDGEKIEGDGTDLTILSSGVIKFAAGGTTNQITLADGALKPVTDNDVDLGTASLEFKNVYVDGTTYTDALGFGTVVMTLPTADGSADQILTTDGSGTLSFVDNSGGTDWQAIKTGNFTASAGQGVFANTTSSAFTVTLPSSPSLGDEVSIIDYAGTFDTNNLTVGRNSQPIMGEAADLTVAVERSAFTLVYVDSTQGWLLKDK